VIVFGLLLLGISRAKTAAKSSVRYGFYTLSGLCAVLIAAIAAAGVYTMTQKRSSGKPPPKAAAAGQVPTASRRYTARSELTLAADIPP
jgi:uncharacterized protein HemX